MKILADQNIPSVADAFADLGEVVLMPGREIQRQHLLDCQCLITRTVTRVDENLLSGSAVEFVGTATIGTDHIHRPISSKDGNIWKAQPGFPGLDAFLPALITEGHMRRGIPLERLVEMVTINAASPSTSSRRDYCVAGLHGRN